MSAPVSYREFSKPELLKLVQALLVIARVFRSGEAATYRAVERLDREYPGWETWR